MLQSTKAQTVLSGILLSNAIVYGLGYVSIELLKEYGWFVFVILPFLLGFITLYIIGRKYELKIRQILKLSVLNLLFSCFCMLVFAMEGIICLLMASPLLLLLTLIGAYMGYALSNKNNPKKKVYLYPIIVLISVSFLGFDLANNHSNLIPVKTELLIDAPKEVVWNNLVAFGEIPEPQELLFQSGISYPTHAEIRGMGVGAIRYCNFTTGSFVEPITTWDAPNLMQFDVIDQPIPMHEWNPFWDIHPPHLEGYFLSRKGQFELFETKEGQTLLVGTTFYTIDINPVSYWEIWTNYILHKIHFRVLNHIKHQSEQSLTA